MIVSLGIHQSPGINLPEKRNYCRDFSRIHIVGGILGETFDILLLHIGIESHERDKLALDAILHPARIG